MMTHGRIGWLSALFLAGSMIVACGKKEVPPPQPEEIPLVRVGDAVITEQDFAFEIQRRQEQRRPASDARSVLQDLIERSIMLQKAQEDALMDDPAIRRQVENQILTQWLEQSLQREKNAVTVSEDELRALYDADIARHTRPAAVRVAVLYRKLNPYDPQETRESLRAELEAARSAYLDDPAGANQQGRIPGFGSIAAEVSEDTISRYRGGDLGWLDPDRSGYRWPDEIMRVAFSLGVGDVSEVISSDDGLFVVMKSDERPSTVIPFEEAVITMRRRAISEKQRALEDSFRSNLLASVHVSINEEKAARLSLPRPDEPEAPALVPVSGRMPLTPFSPSPIDEPAPGSTP